MQRARNFFGTQWDPIDVKEYVSLALQVLSYYAFILINGTYLIGCTLNTFTAIVDLSRFNNSCLKSPASTLFDLTFQSRALRSALSA